ncbi:unnamed protein product [Microthlaspi erraticum]|uniref:Uncharacterized protein n=1 Tax=Microthlaspi erraticum TaxID=1685480 RepID=A0A6D2K6Q8_9BRAS|nr:unnamed protein product [Microthlaspi erraticum]
MEGLRGSGQTTGNITAYLQGTRNTRLGIPVLATLASLNGNDRWLLPPARSENMRSYLAKRSNLRPARMWADSLAQMNTGINLRSWLGKLRSIGYGMKEMGDYIDKSSIHRQIRN